MILYLNGKSKKNYGYYPDWIKFDYVNEYNQYVTITLEVFGDTFYANDKISTRSKGLRIWIVETVFRQHCVEVNCEDLPFEIPEQVLIDGLKKATNFRVGLYPAGENRCDEQDCDIYDCEGSLEVFDGTNYKEFNFKFEPEITLY